MEEQKFLSGGWGSAAQEDKMDRETFFREVMGVQTRELLDWGVENAIEKTVWKGEILLRAGEQ